MTAILHATRETRFDPGTLSGVPDAVARYFRFALRAGEPLATGAIVRHTGWFTMKLGADGAPFTSIERFSARPPAFRWSARIRAGRIVRIHVRDSYRAGRGSIEARVAGIRVMRRSNTPEIASGALLRWLAEAVWLPSALLPENGVRWDALGDNTARATVSDAGTTVSMDVVFGPYGEIARVSADRYRDVNGRGVLTPWVAYSANYERHGGMMVPTTGWVEWVLPEGRLVYWRARMTGYQADGRAGGPAD